ncbi:3-hydroxyacyl-CoA dehydrogenase family protein [Amorphus coralli]|uniref:3-hydroxyacyl-CoA dehydrogenase family protein n=1 Tax=Amorphus coralli TaxID=340680 RepID=UPI00036C9076|nr:3-hydroxyacyl-CoA dehydrogenase NAD-binding domain-containing protein [Amorphus coralli]
MSETRSIAVIGGGTIGCGWAVLFAAAGHDAVVVDPDATVAHRLAETWDTARPVLERLGHPVATSRPPVHVARVADLPFVPDFVQEALPERMAIKRTALAELEAAIPATTVIASSSSGLSVTDMQAGMAHPGRMILAHPCNPPYLMPTVEIGTGARTDPALLDGAAAFYEGLGKVVLRLRKEAPGHLVNRLQAALWREAVNIASEGIASVKDAELAVTAGLGARWSVIGPTTIFHLAGGSAGLPKFLDDLGDDVERWWDSLGAPRLDARTRAILTDGMAEIADGRSPEAIAAERDRVMLDLIDCLNANKDPKTGSDTQGGTA